MKAVKTGHNRAASTPYPDGAKCAAKLPIGYEWPPFFGHSGDEIARGARMGDNRGQHRDLRTGCEG
jgi:hypothetical protein